MRKILVGVTVFCLLILITGCDMEDLEALTSDDSDLTLVNSYKSSDSNKYAYYIEGTIKNNGNYDYSYVQVTFITYDEDGNTIGSCLDNNSGLSAGGTWKFNAICTNGTDEVAKYELKEITGY